MHGQIIFFYCKFYRSCDILIVATIKHKTFACKCFMFYHSCDMGFIGIISASTVSRLFVPQAIHSLNYLYDVWTIHMMDILCDGRLLPWTGCLVPQTWLEQS